MYYGRRLATLLSWILLLFWRTSGLNCTNTRHFTNALTIAQNTEQGRKALTSLHSQKSKNQSRSSWYGTSKMSTKLWTQTSNSGTSENVNLTDSHQLYLHKNSKIRYQSKRLKKIEKMKNQIPWKIGLSCLQMNTSIMSKK